MGCFQSNMRQMNYGGLNKYKKLSEDEKSDHHSLEKPHDARETKPKIVSYQCPIDPREPQLPPRKKDPISYLDSQGFTVRNEKGFIDLDSLDTAVAKSVLSQQEWIYEDTRIDMNSYDKIDLSQLTAKV